MSRWVLALLSRIGLTRPELRAWAMYDWANSAFITTVVTVVFPLYYASVVAQDLPREVATSRFATATAVALSVVAVLSPVLGALSDRAGRIKLMLGAFAGLGVVATLGLATVGPGDWVWGLVLFGLGNVGVTGSIVFSDALLRHIARDDELDRVSTAGYALGYLGGGLLLGAQLVLLLKPQWFGLADAGAASRVAFASVAVWWALFSVPLFRRIPEPKPDVDAARPPVSLRGTFTQLARTFGGLRKHREALLLLVAYLLYSDGIGTIIRLSTLYGTELGIGRGALIGTLLMTQVVGVPCAVLFGRAAGRVGVKNALMFSLAVYVGVTFLGYFMRTPVHFFALALLVGMVQGGSQALSRSLFAQMVPRDRAAEFFGLFSVFEKVTAVAGPLVFAATVQLTGSSRQAVLSLLFFFVAGAAVLSRVNVDAGRRAAREAEAQAGWSGDGAVAPSPVPERASDASRGG
ncbi:MFS transporter [Comamonas sp. JC664]|uniref:MFS transporter n=1 Tax=Comamonas sp. JC664 TaxID=2801917 RepID=UPI00191FF283|nr:MFS transporter [Comamonas sp. JC664]MBL0698791.1 MFS transporter [Comamonas sp. JC664]GHG78923.1 permease [Comamonas sp. KCTC 72670]